MGDAVATAYRQAGYEVVSIPGARDVSAVNVRIIEFWSWYSAEGVLDKVLSKKSLLQSIRAGSRHK